MNLRMRHRTLLAATFLLASFPVFGAELVEKIVARVNDRLITASEFEKRFTVFISSPQAGNNPIEARKKLLSELIDEKLLEERAKELSVAATDEEVETMQEQLSDVLDYIGMLQKVDTSTVAPTAQILTHMNAMREDTPWESWPTEEILANAPRSEDGFFRVPAVLEGIEGEAERGEEAGRG